MSSEVLYSLPTNFCKWWTITFRHNTCNLINTYLLLVLSRAVCFSLKKLNIRQKFQFWNTLHLDIVDLFQTGSMCEILSVYFDKLQNLFSSKLELVWLSFLGFLSRDCILGVPFKGLYSRVPFKGLYSRVPLKNLYSRVPFKSLYARVLVKGLYSRVPFKGLYFRVPFKKLYSRVHFKGLYSRVPFKGLNSRVCILEFLSGVCMLGFFQGTIF